MATKEAVIARASGTSIGTEVPLLGVHEGVAIFVDGSLSVGIEGWLTTPDYVSDGLQIERHTALRTFLRQTGREGNISVQVAYRQNGRFKEVGALMRQSQCKLDGINEFLSEHAELHEQRLASGEIRLCRLQVFLTRKPGVSASVRTKRAKEAIRQEILHEEDRHPNTTLGRVLNQFERILRPLRAKVEPQFLLGNPIHPIQESEFAAGKAQLSKLAGDLCRLLGGMGGHSYVMGTDDWISTYYEHWNKGSYASGARPRKFDPAQDRDISDYFVVSPFDWDPNGVKFPLPVFVSDGLFHTVLSLRNPPDPIAPSHMLGLCCYAGITQADLIVNLRPSSRERRMKALDKHCRHLQSLKPADRYKTAIDQLRAEVAELGKGEEEVFEVQHLVHVWASTIQELESSVRAIKTVSSAANDMEFIEEAEGLWPYWLCTQPGWVDYRDSHRVNFLNTWQAVGLIPFFAPPTGLEGEKPQVGAVFENLQGGLTNVQFDNPLVRTQAGLILGGAGSGKSFFLNQLLFQHARLNPKVIIVDIGESYSGYCESVGGSFFRFSLDSDEFRLNPFDLCKGRTKLESDDADMLLSFLVTLMFTKNDDTPNETEDRVMAEALEILVRTREGREFTLSDYREQIQTMEGAVGKRLSDKLFRWCAPNGQWKNLFDGKTNLSLNKDTIVFELKAFEDHPEVLAVLFSVVFTQVAAIAERASGLKILAFDEAAILMRNEKVWKFIDKAYRTFRKLGVRPWGLSQSFSEWLGPSGNDLGVVNNIGQLCVLSMGELGYNPLIRAFELSETEAAALRDVRTEKGVFSQCFYLQFTKPRKSATLVIRPTPLAYAMSTTDSADRDEIRRIRAEAPSLTAALTTFAAEYPNGVVRSRMQAALRKA